MNNITSHIILQPTNSSSSMTMTLDTMVSLTSNTSMLKHAHYLTNFSDSLLPVLVLIVTQPTQVEVTRESSMYNDLEF